MAYICRLAPWGSQRTQGHAQWFHYSQGAAPRARSVRADRPPPWWVAYLVKRRQARNVFWLLGI